MHMHMHMQALALMDKALEVDELSAFEVYAPDETGYAPIGAHFLAGERYPSTHSPNEHYPSEYYPPDTKYAPSLKPIEVSTSVDIPSTVH